MPVLDTGIFFLREPSFKEDGRVKPGHEELEEVVASLRLS
jgi:hypothetical protein